MKIIQTNQTNTTLTFSMVNKSIFDRYMKEFHDKKIKFAGLFTKVFQFQFDEEGFFPGEDGDNFIEDKDGGLWKCEGCPIKQLQNFDEAVFVRV